MTSVNFLHKNTLLLQVFLLFSVLGFNVWSVTLPYENKNLYNWVDNPSAEAQQVEQAGVRLREAIANPEFALHRWIELPTSPAARKKTVQHLSIREAILLALRYNPNIQNAELDRIIQRYQLR